MYPRRMDARGEGTPPRDGERAPEPRPGAARAEDADGEWDAARVRGLRRRLGETQREFADRLGTTQQTVSEWERRARRPRRMARRLLRLVAEQAASYGAARRRRRGRAGGGRAGRRRRRGGRAVSAGAGGGEALRERELVALWLLGRTPPEALPWPLLRPGRAGRGPGPDVREAAFLLPEGVVRSGAVEAHLAASDFVRHGHDRDPAYGGLVLHLVWTDDRPDAGAPQPLPGGGEAPTCAVGPALGGDPARLRARLRLGPGGAEPCAAFARRRGAPAAAAAVRAEGRRRMAELAWRASALAARHGWSGAWRLLLLRALAASAGRRARGGEPTAALAAAIGAGLGGDPLRRLAALAAEGPGRTIGALRGGGAIGRGRAAEVGWNAALPLLAAGAAAWGDLGLARRTAALVEAWPAPRPYGRTRALRDLLGPPARGAGALHAQGLLRLQDLWCERGGCGACPLSAAGPDAAPAAAPPAGDGRRDGGEADGAGRGRARIGERGQARAGARDRARSRGLRFAVG